VLILASGVHCRYFLGKTGSLPGKKFAYCKEDILNIDRSVINVVYVYGYETVISYPKGKAEEACSSIVG
jgi:hypothetical protein